MKQTFLIATMSFGDAAGRWQLKGVWGTEGDVAEADGEHAGELGFCAGGGGEVAPK
ncbi:MAG: hypothetical protein ABFD96_22230 [Armatimonadia bacterium]